VLPGSLSGFITPKPADFFDTCQVMAQPAVAHSVRGLARKFIEPPMDLSIRFSEQGLRFSAVLFK
jgi:hypothetical protein